MSELLKNLNESFQEIHQSTENDLNFSISGTNNASKSQKQNQSEEYLKMKQLFEQEVGFLRNFNEEILKKNTVL